jgi:hypothetical protein
MPEPRTVQEAGFGTLEVWDLAPSEALLLALLRTLFIEHWREITFGPLIQGAAWEIRATEPPRLSFRDGYLTVDLGASHFHLCIGEHRGEGDTPCDPALAAHRRTARAELFRRINRDGAPDTWGLRLVNGGGEEQMTVLLPSPFLSDRLEFLAEPDFGRLALWDRLRREYLGLGPDGRDRSGRRMTYP